MGIMEPITTRGAKPVRFGLTVDEFEEFTNARPDAERRWQLIDGMATLMTPPNDVHIEIAYNLTRVLDAIFESRGASLRARGEVGVRIPGVDDFEAVADVAVLASPPSFSSYPGNIVLTAEVLSSSNTIGEMETKGRRYAELPDNLHILLVEQRAVSAVLASRSSDWKPVAYEGYDAIIPLDGLGGSIRLGDLYANTPLAEDRA